MFDSSIPFGGRDTSEQPAGVSAPPANNGKARIRVIGVGGAGNNAVNRMIEAGITSAEYIAVNTDAQILACSKAPVKIQIGIQKTKGLGAGAEPDIGREAAEESKDELARAIENTDLLFITAGMGGGTGTGAAPVIAKLAKERKILTVAVVTQPFDFEGRRRMDNALKGIDALRKVVDTIVIIPNEKITEVVPKNTSVPEAFRVADDVLKQAIRGIADTIVTPSLINLDFADVRTVLKDKGLAYMGVGVAKGENRIITAVRLAVNSPLLETTIVGATSLLINITGGSDLTLAETKAAVELIRGVVDYSANIIYGTCIDENVQDEVEVTVIATGFPAAEEKDTYDAPAQYQPQEVLRPQPQAVNRPAPAVQQPVQQPAPAPRWGQGEAQQTPAVPPAQTPAEREETPAAPVPPAQDSSMPPFMKRFFGKK